MDDTPVSQSSPIMHREPIVEPTCPRCGGPLERIDVRDITDNEPRFVTNGECARKCWRGDDDSIAATRALLILMTAGVKAGKTFDEMVSEHGPQLSDLMERMR